MGAPLIHQRSSRQSYQFILDRVNQRLSNWKTNCLSMAGRVTLTRAIIQAMPSYVMQSAFLPRALCDEIDKKCRNFVWGDTESQRHVHLASWDSICTPRKFGGLGLRSARNINTAFMMKIGWNLCVRKDAMWVRILRSKYKCGTNSIPRVQTSKPGSNMWRGICRNWNLVKENLAWRIGDGNFVNSWIDPWVPNVRNLEELSNSPLSPNEVVESVNKFVTASGQWNWNRFRNRIPYQIVDRIRIILPPSEVAGNDSLAWNDSADGSFTTAQAYKSLLDPTLLINSDIFPCIWRMQCPERMRMFLWKTAHGILMTTNVRRRGFSISDLCPICQHEPETPLHMFRDCGNAWLVWKHVKAEVFLHFFDEVLFDKWLQNNLKTKKRSELGMWDIVFVTVLDRIWWACNEHIFKSVPPVQTEL